MLFPASPPPPTSNLAHLQAGVYRGWHNLPDHLKTKTTWQREGYRLRAAETPAAYCHTRAGDYAVYTAEQVEPIPPSARPRRDYAALYRERYDGYQTPASQQIALAAAAQAVYALNRYTKHHTCTERQRSSMYELKTRLLRILTEHGYCTRAYRAYTPQRTLDCYRCNGTGRGDYADDDHEYYDESADCPRCDGTGVFRTVGGTPYWSLTYTLPGGMVAEKPLIYRWHQPVNEATRWITPIGETPAEPEAVVREPVSELPIRLREIPALKALVAWVCDMDDWWSQPPF